MNKHLISVVCLMTVFAPAYAEGKAIFDIRSLCRMPESIAKNNLPVEIGMFEIEEVENPKYGHEEIWSLKNNEALEALGLRMLRIEIHQGKVQSVWFTNSKAEQLNSETFKENLQKAGLKESDLKALMSEHRVNNNDGYVIRILGSGDYYECFEHHAGH